MAPNSSLRKHFSRTETLRLIKYIKDVGMLWSKTDISNSCTARRNAAWQTVADRMGKPTKVIRNKWYNLRSQYRRFRKVMLRSLAGGAPTQMCKPQWYPYEALEFLTEGVDLGTANELHSPSPAPSNDQHSDASLSVNITEAMVKIVDVQQISPAYSITSIPESPRSNGLNEPPTHASNVESPARQTSNLCQSTAPTNDQNSDALLSVNITEAMVNIVDVQQISPEYGIASIPGSPSSNGQNESSTQAGDVGLLVCQTLRPRSESDSPRAENVVPGFIEQSTITQKQFERKRHLAGFIDLMFQHLMEKERKQLPNIQLRLLQVLNEFPSVREYNP